MSKRESKTSKSKMLKRENTIVSNHSEKTTVKKLDFRDQSYIHPHFASLVPSR